MESYIVYNVNECLFKDERVELIEKFPFLDAYLVKIEEKNFSLLKKYCSKIEKVRNSNIKTQLKKVKQFISAENFYKHNLFGQGVCVAVMDTGVTSSLDFCIPNLRIIHFEDYVNDKNLPYDDNGHGTFVCGVIGGNGLLSCGEYAGIAPKCNLIVIKALNSSGEGTSEQILRAMQWVASNKRKYNIRVLCMSFGCVPSKDNDVLSSGANTLWHNGIVVVAAGGNDGPGFNTITSPGRARNIITVGALDNLDNIISVAPFSSRGDTKSRIVKPDILAPGTNIVSVSNKIGKQNYQVMSGTSVSTPIIAGVCALFCQKYPKATPDMIKSLLYKNALDIGTNKYSQGRGVFVYR